MILEKALTLELAQFEDSEFYDKLTRARREASTRPLSWSCARSASCRTSISLVALRRAARCSSRRWAVLVLVARGRARRSSPRRKFSGDAFRLFRWRTPETRKQIYLETVLAREDYAKEVKLFGLGPRFLERYETIFERLYGEDRALTLRRGVLGLRARPARHASRSTARTRGSRSRRARRASRSAR